VSPVGPSQCVARWLRTDGCGIFATPPTLLPPSANIVSFHFVHRHSRKALDKALARSLGRKALAHNLDRSAAARNLDRNAWARSRYCHRVRAHRLVQKPRGTER
jgi:hypothetical protein